MSEKNYIENEVYFSARGASVPVVKRYYCDVMHFFPMSTLAPLLRE